MQRWNGWGDETVSMDVPAAGVELLQELVGPGQPQPDYPRDKFLQRMPDSRLPPHPLVSFDPGLRLDHAHGQSLPDWIGLRGGILQRFPDGVARPPSPEAVAELLRRAAEWDAAVIPYGGGTSVVGHLQVPEGSRPVLSLSLQRLQRLVHLDAESRLAVFEAGIRGPSIEDQLRSRGFTLGHFPQSFEYSSLGGWVATRSSGQQSHYYGRIEQLFAGGELLTPRGRLQLPAFPASAAGPDLRQLVLGSEGRLGVLTRVAVRLSPLPEKDEVFAVFFRDWSRALEGVRRLAGGGLPLSMLRLSNPLETRTSLVLAGNPRLVAALRFYLRRRAVAPGQACLCLVGITGPARMVRATRRQALSALRAGGGVAGGRSIGTAWMRNRFRSAYLRNTLWERGYAVDTLETAVTWERVDRTMQAIESSLNAALEPDNERVLCFSHLSHVYPTGSSVYTTFIFRLASKPEETLRRWQMLKAAASRAVVACGGTISHQHGVGVDHRPYLAAEKGDLGIGTLRRVLEYFDPDRRMNPGKLLPDE